MEEKIVDWLLDIAKMGLPINKENLLDSIQKIVQAGEMKTPFEEGRPGRRWFELFLKRHPRVSQKHSEYLSKARANVSEKKIRKWFQEVKTLLRENVDILKDPQRLFNTDETAFFLAPKGGLILAAKGESFFDVSARSDKENVTTLVTVNAAGEIAPPLTIFKYRRLPQAIVKSAPSQWGIGISDSGWMNGETFFEYITNVFHPYLIEQKIPLPVVLFLDGHKSHITMYLNEFCRENNIIVCALCPNATHILQPLDVAVFGP